MKIHSEIGSGNTGNTW